jgi:hypothetical protein
VAEPTALPLDYSPLLYDNIINEYDISNITVILEDYILPIAVSEPYAEAELPVMAETPSPSFDPYTANPAIIEPQPNSLTPVIVTGIISLIIAGAFFIYWRKREKKKT